MSGLTLRWVAVKLESNVSFGLEARSKPANLEDLPVAVSFLPYTDPPAHVV
jgi:hypothetical protein